MIRPEDKVKLYFKLISQIDTATNEYIMILGEKNGKRNLPFPISRKEGEDLLAAVQPEDSAHAPWTNLFKEVLAATGTIVDNITITNIVDGHYMAEMTLLQYGTATTAQVPAAEALVIAMSQRCDFYITKELIEKQFVKNARENTVALPLNTLTIEMLKEALDNAIKNENYELASHLRDEIKHRK